MTRDRDICALCDEYSVKQADPEQAAIGMGRCLARTSGHLSTHVGWDDGACVLFRLDRPNLAKRRRYVEAQRHRQEDAKNKQ